MRFIIILIGALFFVGQRNVTAQEQDAGVLIKDSLDFVSRMQQDTSSVGRVNVFQDERLRKLLETDLTINSTNPGFSGYRIQIFSGRSVDKERAISVKERFQELFPMVRAYVVYQAPDFRVRVGNFRSKLECIPLYHTVKKEFPDCYPVKTEIQFLDLIPPPIQEEEPETDIN